MTMNRILLLAFALTCFGTVAADGTANLLGEAEKLHQQAVALQGGWTSTEALIKQVHKLEADGKKREAAEQATRARDMARLSLDRARALAESWSEPDYLQ